MQRYDELLASIAPTGPGGREILDPATDELIGTVPEHTVQDLDNALTAAVAAGSSWAALTDEMRTAYLRTAASAIEDSLEALAMLLSREQGKPLNGPNARQEVNACITWLLDAANTPLPGKTLIDDGEKFAELRYRPFGVVGAITPWNWPMMISVWQFAAALRMGNTVVMKPSEYTPMSGLAIVAVVASALPKGVLQAVAGAGELGSALVESPLVAKVMFTGSIATGKRVIRASAENVTPLTLELGGNDAGIVLPDVDPESIAEKVFWGAFSNTGQTCAALKRLYVPDEIYDDVVSAVTAFAATVPMGVGVEEGNLLGPLQNEMQYRVVERLVDAARDSGARITLGGDPDPDQPGFFYPTTIVADIDPANPLVVEEQFGPALPIIRYHDLDEAIRLVNADRTGLGASVWATDPRLAQRVARRIEAGTVWINDHGAVDPRLPFGGAKMSGYGLEFGADGMKAVSQPQVIAR